ncbi:MAG TPA: hypothetical protein ENK91_11305, partial [Bacteroidetes bacterium]|nr:hypothetical protein [Bacteroidota bacterium]
PFTIYFSNFDYTNPQNEKYYIKIDGINDNWISLENGKNNITYTNLSPGDYSLQIKNNNDIRSLNIVIRPPFWDTLWFKIILSLAVISLLLFLFRIYFLRREEKLEKQILTSKMEILKLNNEKYKSDIKISNSKLLSFSAQMAYKNTVLNEIKDKLNSIGSNNPLEIKRIIRILDNEINEENYWDQFNIYFDKVDKNFLNTFSKKHPTLTNNDIRMASLLRLKLSTKEISALLNISVRGVEKGKYRLKKRLGLSADQDLIKYINNF